MWHTVYRVIFALIPYKSYGLNGRSSTVELILYKSYMFIYMYIYMYELKVFLRVTTSKEIKMNSHPDYFFVP